MDNLPLRYYNPHQEAPQCPMAWNPVKGVYPNIVPPNDIGTEYVPGTIKFQSCRWLCPEHCMDDAVKDQLHMKAREPLQQPTEVSCHSDAAAVCCVLC